MPNGTKNIKQIKFYNCGYCVNNLKHMYKNEKSKKVKFQARVMLIEHEIHGNILVDTGYSHRIYESGITSKLYNMINPAYYTSKDHILNQLRSEGIERVDIAAVILTHLHPDHTGAVPDFIDTPLIMSEKAKSKITNNSFNELILSSQINSSDVARTTGVVLDERSPIKGFKGRDLFGDNSIWLIELKGHSYGQLGVYLPELEVFYVADAIWNLEKMNQELRYIPRLVQKDYKQYMETVRKLSILMELGNIELISTHGGEVYDHGE